ncbi:hypothetical protein H0W26_01575 [Candidatus Dependentiae bacterium]|nr:hypothetical protein [Candidatus Dependentiae bacterium]
MNNTSQARYLRNSKAISQLSCYVSDFFQSLKQWNEMAKADPLKSYLMYAIEEVHKRSMGTIIGWQHAGTLFSQPFIPLR